MRVWEYEDMEYEGMRVLIIVIYFTVNNRRGSFII